MPFLQSRPFQHLFQNIHPFRVSCTTLSWSHFLWSCPLHRATFVLCDILLPAVANSFSGPQFPWSRIFLKMFLLCRATAARWDTFLQAAANFLRVPHFTKQFLIVLGVINLQASAMKCTPGNTYVVW
jgi:hypothetical protein